MNGKTIATIDGPASIAKSYSPNGNVYVLIGNNGNGDSCPYQYNIFDISKNGIEKTKSFGSCARVSSVHATGPIWKISMPGPAYNGEYIYYYHGGNKIRLTKESISTPVRSIHIDGLAKIVKLGGSVETRDGTPYFILGRKIKFSASMGGVMYLSELPIETSNTPPTGKYGKYVIKIEMPMAGPMITKFLGY